jgi:Tol biopolymer transport system component
VSARFWLALALLVGTLACGPAGQGSGDGALGPGSQAATAAALGQAPAPTGQPVPFGGAPAAGASPSPQPLTAANVAGRLVVARGDAIEVIEGGASRKVFTADLGGSLKDPIFSPDGSQIAFAYAPPRPRLPPSAPIVDQLLYSDIMAVGTDGAGPRVVAAHDVKGAVLETPSWAPDGRSIYFGYYAPHYGSPAGTPRSGGQADTLIGETIEIRRVDLATGASTAVVTKGNNPVASPDGQSLLYVGEDFAAGPSLRRVKPDGSGDAEVEPPGDFASILAPRFSPDGATIAFAGAQLPRPPSAQPKAAGPLGRLAALIAPGPAEAHGLPWEIWTVPAGGGQPKQLTIFAEDTPYPAWSADGGKLLVYAAGGLYLVEAGSGNTEALSSDGAHGGMDWRSKP